MPREFKDFESSMQIAIVVPIYKTNLNNYEKVSLNSILNVFANCRKIIVKPEGLSVSEIDHFEEFDGVESFSSSYFESISAYNELMLSRCFYERFISYKYILVTQLDVYLFSNKIGYWLEQDYDYVGAPWVSNSYFSILFYRIRMLVEKNIFKNHSKIYKYETRNEVGNGGFSLRKVESHINVIDKMQDKIVHYLNNQRQHSFNEDVFWSMEPIRNGINFRKPSMKEALKFAFDTNPEKMLKLNDNCLPMACHGWYKRKHLKFWRKIILGHIN